MYSTESNKNMQITAGLRTWRRRDMGIISTLLSFVREIHLKRTSNMELLCLPVLTWWRHKKETFSALLAICAGNHQSPVNSPHKGQLRGAMIFSLICPWINGWVNNGEAGDLRHHRAHYDVIVMNLNKVLNLQGSFGDLRRRGAHLTSL